jgi:MFS family permease
MTKKSMAAGTQSPEIQPALPATLLALVWFPFACGYFISYGFRTINAMMAPELVRDLGVNPNQLGLLTSAYFLSFALFQLPLGVLLDRFGPRRVVAALLLCAAAGAAVFGLAQSLGGLVVGRALIGLGVSACLMGAIKAFVQWFPMNRLATLNGWLFAAGGLGAIMATGPVEAALGYTDWRSLFFAVSAFTAAIAAFVFFAVPERGEAGKTESFQEMLGGLKTVFRSRLFWRVSPMFASVQGGFLAVQGLWVTPWLRDVAGFDRAEIAQMLTWLAFVITVGFVIIGNLADWLSRRGVDTMTVLQVGCGISIAAFSLIALGVVQGEVVIWTVYCLCGTSSVLVYTILSKRFPRHLTGRASTATNMMMFIAGFGLQWGLGAVLNLWSATDGHIPLAAYRAAFAIPLTLQCLAYAWMLFSKDVPPPGAEVRA